MAAKVQSCGGRGTGQAGGRIKCPLSLKLKLARPTMGMFPSPLYGPCSTLSWHSALFFPPTTQSSEQGFVTALFLPNTSPKLPTSTQEILKHLFGQKWEGTALLLPDILNIFDFFPPSILQVQLYLCLPVPTGMAPFAPQGLCIVRDIRRCDSRVSTPVMVAASKLCPLGFSITRPLN